MSRKLASRAN